MNKCLDARFSTDSVYESLETDYFWIFGCLFIRSESDPKLGLALGFGCKDHGVYSESLFVLIFVMTIHRQAARY